MTGEGLQQSSLLLHMSQSNLTPLELVAAHGSCLPDVPARSTALLPPGQAVWSMDAMPWENLSLQPRLRAASSGRALRWPNSHLPSFSHPTLPLHIILGIIAAVWGSRELQLLNQWAHACLDRSPSGFGTRLRLHNANYKGSVTDMKGLGKH